MRALGAPVRPAGHGIRSAARTGPAPRGRRGQTGLLAAARRGVRRHPAVAARRQGGGRGDQPAGTPFTRRSVRRRYQHLFGRAHPRDRRQADRKGHPLRRRPSRAHPGSCLPRRTQHHGRRHAGNLCPHPPYPGNDGHRRHPLRSGRVRPGGQDSEQHAGLSTLRRAGRGNRHRAAQRCRAGRAAAHHGPWDRATASCFATTA